MPAARQLTLGLVAVYAVWAIMLFDLNFFFAVKGAAVFGRLANLSFVPLLILIAFRGMTAPSKKWMWYAPMLLLLAVGMATIPIFTNRFLGWVGIQILLSHYAIAVATVLFVRTPMDALPILGMVVARFAWFGFFAGASGHVNWDPFTANTNDFGGLMVQGVALCFWFGMATRTRWQRLLLFGLALYCIIGVVTSLARGAFIALVLIAFIAWMRSPRKGLTGAGMVMGVLVVFLAASMFVDNGERGAQHFRTGTFWEQIMSTFEEGAEEGTGAHRWSLWTAAAKVWQTHPIFGVGPNNFGVFAAQHFRPGEIAGFENVGQFWGLNTHSAYMQVLSEFGLVGLAALIWLMIDFVRKNRALRRPDAVAIWSGLGISKKVDLHALSLGLEAAFVAITLCNAIYSSFLQPWFITVWAVNRMLYGLTLPASEAATRSARFVPRASLRQRQAII